VIRASRAELPIGFAHRGARADAPENTLQAFELALKLGARGLESDVWLTADDVAVLDHDGKVGSRFRRRAIAALNRWQLPPHIPSLRDLYQRLGSDFELSLDIKDERAAAICIEVALEQGALDRLWMCHSSVDQLCEWRALSSEPVLVLSTRKAALSPPLASAVVALESVGIGALNLPAAQWEPNLVSAVHRAGLVSLAWGVQRPEMIRRLLALGVGGVYSDHVAMMVSELEKLQG
jgi:glycerophosphoryl diester phosphodiesterase